MTEKFKRFLEIQKYFWKTLQLLCLHDIIHMVSWRKLEARNQFIIA